MGLKEGVRSAWDKALSPLFEEFSAEVLVQSVDTASTVTDPLYGEPVQEKRFTDPVAVRARLKLEKDRLVLPGGEDIEIDGRITVRSDELEAQGIALEIGSRITFPACAAPAAAGRLDKDGRMCLIGVQETGCNSRRLSPPIHKFCDEIIYSGLSAERMNKFMSEQKIRPLNCESAEAVSRKLPARPLPYPGFTGYLETGTSSNSIKGEPSLSFRRLIHFSQFRLSSFGNSTRK